VASGADPEKVGFHSSLLQRGNEKLFSLFRGKEVDCYERSPQARDQQLFCFCLAHKRGVGGGVMKSFERRHLAEARRRFGALCRDFFKIRPSASQPAPVYRKVRKIFEEGIRDALP
jgi:hypothetical protein